MHARAHMGSHEGRYGFTCAAVMGLDSPAVSAQVTKHFVTIFSKTCNNGTCGICLKSPFKQGWPAI